GDATIHLEAVARHDPNDASGVIRLAYLAHSEGRREEAAKLCARAERIDPSSPAIYHLWGLLLSEQERWEEAEKRLRKALALAPTHGGSNKALSEALLHQGQATDAVRYARRAVRWGPPNSPQPLLTLADAYEAAGRTPDARNALERAL